MCNGLLKCNPVDVDTSRSGCVYETGRYCKYPPIVNINKKR